MAARIDVAGNARYAAGLFRAGAGAMIFALPMMMTQEMWEMGAAMEPWRLAALMLVTLPMLTGLSFYAGFEPTFSLLDNVLDAFAAMAVSAVACAIVLAVFGVLETGLPAQEIAGRLAVLSLAASIGALLADKQFGDRQSEEDETRQRAWSVGNAYASRLFVMAVGAIFLALNIAPTDEVEIIAAQMDPWRAAGLCLMSVVLLHAMLTLADPECRAPLGRPHLLRTAAGYGVCLLLSAFILWCFGRLDDLGASEAAEQIVTLAFPAALGAGAARLILNNGEGERDG